MAFLASKVVRYDAMCRAIAEAYRVDEVKDIRDKALALEMYARMADNTEAETQACEIRLRAERKAGQLLKEIEKAKGGRPPKNLSDGFTSSKTLSDYGVTRQQSSDWQKLADVPDDDFEASLTRHRPTTSGIIAASTPPKVAPVSTDALWLWGRLRDYERDLIYNRDPNEFLVTLREDMLDDVLRLAPLVAAWLNRVGDADEARRRRAETQSDHRPDRRNKAG
jgi:hypothetical protein